MKNFLKMISPAADLLMLPFVYPAAWLLKLIRRGGVERLPLCKIALLQVGVFPIRDHYYEPQFKPDYDTDFSANRQLTGIDWNTTGQLENLEKFVFSDELVDLPVEEPKTRDFYLNNTAFKSGDAEFWYQIIRAFKPKKIIEIGSGNSTLLAIKAIRRNREENSDYKCEHICVEPYEMPWLESTGVTVIREKVENLKIDFFSQLDENDILFIDSSHVIRPNGDVLFEFLTLLPTLQRGVIVHIHDIFSPRNYLKEWLRDSVLFWNEQYILEAFLTENKNWKIMGALNYLHHNHYDELKAVAPHLTPEREPGSFYIQKIS